MGFLPSSLCFLTVSAASAQTTEQLRINYLLVFARMIRQYAFFEYDHYICIEIEDIYMEKMTGKVWVLGDDIDTDIIIDRVPCIKNH